MSFIKVIPQSFRDRYRTQWRKIDLKIQTVYGKIQRQFCRPSFPKEFNNGKIYLHLGCGFVNHPEFINIDGLPAPHIHYIRPIDNLSPFKKNSVNLIYACHCLEHFPHAKVPEVLTEWFRVLQQGGILRLSVPDFDLLLNIYKENGNDINTIICPLLGGQDYEFNFHFTVFNRLSLETLLKNAGFKQIQEWQPGTCKLTTFDDWSSRQILSNEKYYPVSLNIEAIK
jgi:SAM-dependent methyltransferase